MNYEYRFINEKYVLHDEGEPIGQPLDEVAIALDKDSGTLRPGLRGDVLVVDGNPLARISDTRKIRFVVTNGRRYDPAPLWRSVGFVP